MTTSLQGSVACVHASANDVPPLSPPSLWGLCWRAFIFCKSTVNSFLWAVINSVVASRFPSTAANKCERHGLFWKFGVIHTQKH